MSYVDIFNTDPIQDLFAGIVPNSVMVADHESTIQGLSLKSGEILIGSGAGKIPNVASLQGTPKQINIDYLLNVGNRVLKFGLPQDLDLDSSPTFNKITTDTVDTKSLIIDGSEIDFKKYVTLADDQTISGQKRFGKPLLPSTIDIDLGSTIHKFRSLYMGRGAGNIHLGIDTVIGNAAQMFLQSSGDGYSQIHFGRDSSSISNTKWLLSSRTSGNGNAFELYRGPYLTGTGSYQKIWSTSGNDGQTSFVIETDSESTSTGSVTFAGGVGIAKTLHAEDIITDSIDTKALNINGSAITPGNYVTLDGAQGITGNKGFSGQVKFSGSVYVGPNLEYDLTTMPWQYLQDVDQDLTKVSDVEFASIDATNITTSSLTVSDSITIPQVTPNTVVGANSDGKLQSLALASANGITTTVSDNVLTINTPQDLQTTASPTFNAMTVTTITSPGSTDPINLMKPLYVDGAITPHPSAVGRRSLGTIASRWANLRLGWDGSVCDIESYHGGLLWAKIGSGAGKETRLDYGPIWRLICLEDASGNDLTLNSYENSTSVRILTVKGIGPNRHQTIFNYDLDSTARTNGSVVFKGGVGIEKSLHALNIGATTVNATTVNATTVNVNGTAVTPTNYVTLNTTQTISGTKTFSSSVLSSSTSVNLGSAVSPFGNIYLSRTYGSGESAVSGLVQAGIGIRASRRAELHLHSAGDEVAEIMFGTDSREDKNVKWAFSSREPSTNDAFRLFRGPKLTGGAFTTIVEVTGSGADTGQTRFLTGTDSVSTTTGAVTFAGGVGVSKTLHAKDIVTTGNIGDYDNTVNKLFAKDLDVSGDITFNSNRLHADGTINGHWAPIGGGSIKGRVHP